MSLPLSMSLDDEDVPMSFDDDTDMVKVERRIRKAKEMSLDDDDDANLEKLKRKKKILYTYDFDGVREESMSRIENLPLKMTQKIENQKKFSDDDLIIPSLDLFELKQHLPAVAETFRTKDWSLLQKYCFAMGDSSSTKNLSLEEALKNELVATCFWFLLTKACPPYVKEYLVSALQWILQRPKPTNMHVDQTFIDDLVVYALCLDDKEIIRQVCEAIVYVGLLHLTNTVGTGIQTQLVKLACRFSFSRDTRVATSVLAAISSICWYFESGVMREKLVGAVLSDPEWLLNFMREHDDELLQNVFDIIECITRGEYEAGIREVLYYDIIPQVLRMYGRLDGVSLRIHAARIVLKTINRASPDQIEEIVFGSDNFFKVLLRFLKIQQIQTDCMVAIEKILKTEEIESNDNIYAQMIGEQPGAWDLLNNEALIADDILLKYAPPKWLSNDKIFFLQYDR